MFDVKPSFAPQLWNYRSRSTVPNISFCFFSRRTLLVRIRSYIRAATCRQAMGMTIEIRSLPTLTHCYPRNFTFYLADPISSIVSRSLPLGSTATALLPSRDPSPPPCRGSLPLECLPIVSRARAYIQPALRPARSCICPFSSCRKKPSLPCGKHLSRC